MRWVLRIVVVLGLAWSGWWYLSGHGIREGLRGWFAAQEARGWQADYAEIGTTGYPLRHVTTLQSPALADPATGTAWSAEWLEFDSPAIWPGDMIVNFPSSPQLLSYLDQTVQLEAQDMRADLQLHPGLALELERMGLTAGPWLVAGPAGVLMRADAMTMAMVQQDDPARYAITAQADGFTPGEHVRKAGTSTLPKGFETLALDMAVTFDRPWDRTALELSRPQPRVVDLALAELRWGPLQIKLAGNVTVDEAGVPTGKVALKAENWREMLTVAEHGGGLSAEARRAAESVLELMAGISGGSESLDVQLTLRGGNVWLGILPLGPAPRLILH